MNRSVILPADGTSGCRHGTCCTFLAPGTWGTAAAAVGTAGTAGAVGNSKDGEKIGKDYIIQSKVRNKALKFFSFQSF